MPARGCVTDLEMRAFLLGDLPEPQAEGVSSHLEVCPDCEASARRLDDLSDPVIRSLQRVLGATSGDGLAREDVAPTLGREGDPLDPLAAPPGIAATHLPRVKGYELLEELGRGGMGVVFRARHIRLNRVVALKVILSGAFASPAELHRFRAEAEAAAQLDHPHIVPLYEAGDQDGLPYFSMKLIEGTRLSAHVRRLSRHPRIAVRLLVSVTRAIHHAHQRGVIHRDLKPANILIDASGEPHVTDFGLAGRVGTETGATQSGAVVGTPSYMAPEQAAGKKGLTIAVDVYALGAILYELLTGRVPFHAVTPMETVRHVLDQEPEPPRSVNPKADRDLELICLKCLAKDPQRRYGSAEALAADLEHWLAGEPVSVRPPSFASVTRLWLRQNFGAAGWTVILGTVAGLLFGLMNWLSRSSYILSDSRSAYSRLPSLTPPALAPTGPVSPWLPVAVAVPTVVVFFFLGLFVTLLVRPKNRAAEIAAGAVTGLVLGMTGFACGAGSMFVTFLMLGPGSVADSDLRLLSDAAWVEPAPVEPPADPAPQQPGADERSAAAARLLEAYPDLRDVPAAERGDLLYHKLRADLTAAAPFGIWLGLLFNLGMGVTVSLAETLSAGVLLRRRGGIQAMIGPYVELAVPGTLLVIGLSSGATRLSFKWFRDQPGHLPAAVLALTLLALAVTAVLRGWHWLFRVVLHIAWLVSLIAWLMFERSQYELFGG